MSSSAFERFRLPDTGRSRSDGDAGLGLAIVSAIAHGRTAMARNQPGGGAAVSLHLPAAGCFAGKTQPPG